MTLAALPADYVMLACPFCGCPRVRVIEWQRMYAVRCLNLECGVRGPNRWDEQEALDAWNDRQKTYRKSCF